MGYDLNADERARHGVSREVLEAEASKTRTELGELERRLIRGELTADEQRAIGRKQTELARLEEAARPRFAAPSLAELSSSDDWLDTPPPTPPILLTGANGEPFMRDGKVALLVAPGATGKTFALAQLAVAVATGTQWLGTYTTNCKGRVLLALGEEDADEVRRRLWQIVRGLGLDDDARAELRRNLHPLGLSGHSVAFLHRTPDKNLGPTEWFEAFRAELEGRGEWRCIILDPWSRWGGPDAETDAHAATLGVTLLERLTALPGRPAVVVAHHERKRSKKDRGPSEASDTRGSSALVDGARMVASLRRLTDEDGGEGDRLELRVTKANYTVPGPPLELTRGDGGTLLSSAGPPKTEASAPTGEPTAGCPNW